MKLRSFLKSFQQWASIWIGIIFILALSWAVYAWVWITASDWDTLDHTKWNEMVWYTVPSGAIMPFDLGSCPSGWTELTAARGRSIVWVWQWNTAEWWWLWTNWTLWTTNGAETHTITQGQLPNYNLSFSKGQGECTSGIWEDREARWGCGFRSYTINVPSWGSDQPHNNLHPVIAYLYCKKN
jgi:hypothetical protein